MAAQDHVRQFLAMDDADDVLDVRAEIDRGAHQVGAFAESGQSRRIDLVSSLAQQPRHPLIAPAAMPGAVNQNEGGHEFLLDQRNLLKNWRPSALAVVRLMTSRYLDACSTGSSAGLAPLRILSM